MRSNKNNKLKYKRFCMFNFNTHWQLPPNQGNSPNQGDSPPLIPAFFVRMQNGNTLTFKISPTQTVMSLKNLVANQLEIAAADANSLILYNSGIPLADNNRTLEFYEVLRETMLSCVVPDGLNRAPGNVSGQQQPQGANGAAQAGGGAAAVGARAAVPRIDNLATQRLVPANNNQQQAQVDRAPWFSFNRKRKC
jgi:hypothetical protein